MSTGTISTLIQIRGIDCDLVKGVYSNNNTLSVKLTVADTDHNISSFHFPGNVIATLSVNIVTVNLEKNEFIFKNYGDNVGLFESLLEEGYLIDTRKRVQFGYESDVPVVKLIF